jgi:hypothetical protein
MEYINELELVTPEVIMPIEQEAEKPFYHS